MAKFEVNGLDALIGDLGALAQLPDSVAEDILTAEADIVEAEQRIAARDMLKGPYSTGKTASAVRGLLGPLFGYAAGWQAGTAAVCGFLVFFGLGIFSRRRMR